MNLKLSNNAFARLAAPITANQTSFSLQSGQGAKFPTLGENDYFTLTAVKPDSSLEIMYVTARSFDLLTVLRGQENTLAQSFDALTIVENRITAKSIMDEIQLNRSIVTAALQAFQPSVPIGIDQLRLLLLGALGPDQLEATLRDRIALIDGSSAVAGSVSQRVKNATDAFIAALTQEATDRTTYIQNYGYSKQGTNAAISAQASVTKAEYTYYADAAAQYAINSSRAYVLSYTYTATDIRNAIAASEQTLRAEFSGGTGGSSYATQAYVQTYAYSIAQADGAIAAQTLDLRTTVDNNTAAIQTAATTLNGLSAQVYTKIDINGYVTGYGLASSSATGAPTSAFIVNAAAFMVVAPNGNPQPMFSVKQVNGQSVAVFSGQLLIGSGGVVINKDPYFTDIPGNWSGPSNVVVGVGAGGNGPASTFIGMGPSAGGVVFSKERINIDASKTYLLAASLYQDNNFSETCILLIDFYDNNGARLATNWGDQTYSGYALSTQPPAGTWTTYRLGLFGPNAGNGHAIPAGAKTCRIGASLNANPNIASGLMALTGLRLEEQLDGTSIQDGAITAKKVAVDQLSALSAYLGTVDVGVGGYLRSGQPTFNVGSGFFLGSIGGVPKLSIGNPNGNRLTYDGTEFKIFVNPGASVVVSPQNAVYSFASNTQYTNVYVGSYTASLANSNATRLAYSWSLSSEYSGLVLNIAGSPSQPQVSVTATFKFLDQEIDAYLSCTITDLDTGSSYRGETIITVSARAN